MDNNIRLVVPKGILTPSQFTILKVAMKEQIDSFISKVGSFPDSIINYYWTFSGRRSCNNGLW